MRSQVTNHDYNIYTNRSNIYGTLNDETSLLPSTMVPQGENPIYDYEGRTYWYISGPELQTHDYSLVPVLILGIRVLGTDAR